MHVGSFNYYANPLRQTDFSVYYVVNSSRKQI